IGLVDRRDLIRMHTAASLEPTAAAALQRASERRAFLEVEPGTVDRAFYARRARSEHDPRPRVRQLGLVERRRQPEAVPIVAGAEAHALHPPRPGVGAQAPRLQDAVDALHAGRRLDL